ncbi:phospholipase B1, membrane-associated [Ambystoma mexicanum]|uniref:phospholipase B1, membrane-associated n=1 Tax=Ambystoma mexicanum TaxID=8296 RepID=UPI0037E94CFE
MAARRPTTNSAATFFTSSTGLDAPSTSAPIRCRKARAGPPPARKRPSFCSCLVKPKDNSSELLELIDQNIQFQKRLEELMSSGRYNTTDDFAVVLQPFLKHIEPPKLTNGNIDYSFFTPDCFHFTIKGHEELAKGLWNNMFQPEGAKEEVETFATPVQLICPSEDHPYIHTGRRRTKSLASASPKGPHLFHIFILMIIFCF